MRSLKSSGFTALWAALAVAAASVPFSGLTSGVGAVAPQAATMATVTTAASAPVSAGTLTLSTTKKAGVVAWDDLRQEFKSGGLGQCQLTPVAGSPALLDLVGYIGSLSSSAGFKNGEIGVYEFKKQNAPPWNASKCSEVDDGSFTSSETLGVHLGSDAADAFGALVATSATVQLVSHSKKGSLVATLVDAEGNAVGTRSISWSKKGAINTGGAFTGEFSGILLKVTKGSFSLTGAAFEVASAADAFFCTGEGEDSFTNDEGVTVTYIGNADGSPCEGFGIRLGRDGEAQVWFIKPLDVNPEAQFIFTVPWDTIALSSPSDPLPLGSTLPPAYIDFEVPEPNGPTEHEMPYCPDYLFDDTGALVGMPDALSSGYPAARADLQSRDMEPDISGVLQTVGTQFACIGDRSAEIAKASGSGYDATITDLIYLVGDARMLMR